MSPAIAVLAAWFLFGGSHLMLSAPWLRDSLANQLGQHRFLAFYTLITTVSLSLLIAAVARYGGDGPGGPNLSIVPAARWTLGTVAATGALLATAGIVNYPRSPMAVLARRWRASNDINAKPLPARGVIERVTRHPFFVGLALLMGAHALLASTLAALVFFGGFVVIVVVGILMQDRKLLKRHGKVYGAYQSKSSVMPFAAMHRSTGDVTGRFWPMALRSIVGASMLAAMHPLWRLGHGAPFLVIVLIGGLLGVAKQLRASSSD